MFNLRFSQVGFVIVLLVVIGFVVGGRAVVAKTAVPTSLTLHSLTSPVTLAEMDEFATNVLGDPWDMNEPTDLAFYRRESQIQNSTFANGFYSGQLTNGQGGERITFLTANSKNNDAIRIGKIGYNYPINADHYRYLTFRLYKSSTGCASGLVQWFADDSYANSVMGISNSYGVSCEAGWKTYVVDLQQVGIQAGSRTWHGTMRELILHPYAGAGSAGSTMKLDYARLTAENPWTFRPYDVQWSGDGSGGPVTLYASPNDQQLGSDEDIVLATDLDPAGGTYTVRTGLLPAGSYYLAVSNGAGTSWSQAPLILNAPPQISITKPSMTSGADYATVEKGNAWDMNDVDDLNDSAIPIGWDTCVTNESFSGGLYWATDTTCLNTADPYSDSKLIIGHMNPKGSPDPIIDTDKYRYFSFRFLLEGEQDVGEGWVARWGWWQLEKGGLPGSETVMSRDVILLEGWNTYAMDLWANDVIDENHPVQRAWRDSEPNRLRFDPTELHVSLAPRRFAIDWIRLTAMDEVVQGANFPVEYTFAATQATELRFYYDTDQNRENGRSIIGTITRQPETVSQARQPAWWQNSHQLFLPSVMSSTTRCSSSDCFLWNTANVARGDYYICIETNDGLNSTYRCSEAPVRVK